MSESRPSPLDEPESGGRIDTGPGTCAVIEETGVLASGRLGKSHLARQVRPSHQGRPGDESRIAVLPVGEAQHRQVRARQVQVVGVLAHDLGTGVVGRSEGLEEIVIAVEVVIVHLGDVVGLDSREHEVVAAS